MPAADAPLSDPEERLAIVVERSLSLDALISQAWQTFDSNGKEKHEASIGLCSLSLDHGRALRLLIGWFLHLQLRFFDLSMRASSAPFGRGIARPMPI